jgi:biopolymer transport protein ExbB/TolQ
VEGAAKSLSDGEVLEAVERATRRAAAVVRADFKRGLVCVATVASVAPFFGFFGTVAGIYPKLTVGCAAKMQSFGVVSSLRVKQWRQWSGAWSA